MASMSMKVVSLISKPPTDRSDEEIELIWSWLAEKAEILKSKKPEIIKDILRNCSYVKRFRDDVIIRQGDKGNSFYVILSGAVSVFINTEAVPDDPEEATVLVTEETYTEDTTTPGGKGKKELDRTRYGKCVVVFGPGKGFGELALINKDCVRNASIIADEEVDLLEVNRDLFNRCLKAAAEAEFQQRINFVNHCSLFNNWAGRYKRQAAMSLRKEIIEYNKPLAVQGQPTDGLTFVLTGQAVVVLDSLMHFSQYPQLHLHEDPEEFDKKEMLGNLLDPNSDANQQQKLPEGKRNLWEKPVCRQGYIVAEQRQAMRHIEVVLVGPGEIVGDIEQGLGFETYAQSVICLVQTSVYVLDARNFERLINSRRNFKTLVQLKNRAEQKLLSRVGRSLVMQIPLIRCLVHRILEERNQELRKEKAKEFQQLLPSHELTNESGEGLRPSVKETLEITRGPVIDLFGPGTVFFRNKMKRMAKLKAQKAKEMATMSASGGFNPLQRAGMFGISTGSSGTATPAEPASGKETARREKPPGPSQQVHGVISANLHDWETGQDHLSQLEGRIKHWHSDVDQMEQAAVPPPPRGSVQPNPVTTATAGAGSSSHGKTKEAIFQLKRITEAPTQSKLFPGKKIVFRPRHARENSPERVAGGAQTAREAPTQQPQPLKQASLSSIPPTGRSPTDREVFITALRSSSATRFQTPVGGGPSAGPSTAAGLQSTPLIRGPQIKANMPLRVMPLNDIQDPRQLPYTNLQPLHRCKSATQSSTAVGMSAAVDIRESFFAPLGRPENTSKRLRNSRVGSASSSRFSGPGGAGSISARGGLVTGPAAPQQQHYTLQEYLQLKELLKKKERQFLAHRLAMAI